MAAHRNVGAAAPGPVTPRSDEAPALAGARGLNGYRTDSGDCDAKRAATLRARAALRGFGLRRLDGDRWLVSRWDLSRELADSEVERWLAAVGAAA